MSAAREQVTVWEFGKRVQLPFSPPWVHTRVTFSGTTKKEEEDKREEEEEEKKGGEWWRKSVCMLCQEL